MFGGKDIDKAVDRLREEFNNLLRAVTDQAASRIVEVAEEFAPEETDFKSAIYANGPDGDYALTVVEDELSEFLGFHPNLVDAMKLSEEFDNEHERDIDRAARAIVNESLFLAEMKWDDRPAPVPAI